MIIIPAIDIKGGRCVRLFQGMMDRETVFSDSPEAMAKKWEDSGAKMLHIVDLDGAVNGRPGNLKTIKQILSSVNIPIQVGGGIRSRDTVNSYLSMGVSRIVIGTSALNDRGFLEDICMAHNDRIVVGMDVKDGFVSVSGWIEQSSVSPETFLAELKDLNPAAVVYTDIRRDGAMTGPNIEAIKGVADKTSIPVIASGGISSLDDVKEICRLERYGVAGMIIGRAIYTGAVSLQEAFACT